MCYDREGMLRLEMLGCARLARAALQYDSAEEAAVWNAKGAEHLFNYGGLMSRW